MNDKLRNLFLMGIGKKCRWNGRLGARNVHFVLDLRLNMAFCKTTNDSPRLQHVSYCPDVDPSGGTGNP